MIYYSLNYRSVSVADLDANGQKQYSASGELVRKKVQKAYATVQTVGTLSFDDFCRSIAAKGAYSRADILSIVIVITDALVAMVKLGQRVNLGDLGTFAPQLSSEGVLDAKDYNPNSHVKRVYVGWTKPNDMKNFVSASYQLTASKAVRALANAATKAGAASFTVEQSEATQQAAQNLEQLRSKFMVAVNVKNGQDSYGTVSGGGEYKYGAIAVLTATPNTGYGFAKWTDGNEDNPRSITVTSVRSITAEFYQKSDIVISTFVSQAGNPFKVGQVQETINMTGTDFPENDLVLKMRQNGEWVNTNMTYSSAIETQGTFTKSGFTIPAGVDALRVYNGAEPLFTQPVAAE